MAAPMELNILWSHDKNLLKRKITMAIKLGYETIAINNETDEISPKSSKKSTKGLPTIKTPESILPSAEEVEEIKKSLGVKKAIVIKSRFTANFNNIEQTKRIQSDETIRSYDIIAARPDSEKLFQACCETLNIDIISLNLTEKIPFKFKRTMLGVAVGRGIFFEVTYAPAIRDSTFRRFTIANSVVLNDTSRGKNVLLSSGCEHEMEIRGPYDAQNLAMMFGMSPEQAKHSVTLNCKKCLTHAETVNKGVAKCIISVEKLPNQNGDSECSSGAFEEQSKTGNAVTKTQSKNTFTDSTTKSVSVHEPNSKKRKVDSRG